MRNLKPALISTALLALACFLTLPTPALQAQTAPANLQLNRVSDRADLSQTAPMVKTLPQWVASSPQVGVMPDATPINIEVALTRSPAVQAAFQQLLEDQQNPNSPRYHQWLTPQQVGEQFGPTQHDIDAVSSWLTSQGLSVSAIAPNRVFISASATAAVVGHAFNTQFRTYSVGPHQYYSVSSEPSIPTAFSTLIGSITGLSQVELRPMSRFQPAVTPNDTNSSGNHYMFPGDFATIFDINAVYSAGIKGTGQHVAVIGQSAVNPADFTAFENLANLPTNQPNVIVPPTGVTPGYVAGDEGESDLDLQRVIGVAPGITADFLTSGTVGNIQGINFGINYEINTLIDPVMTLSYGACEALAGSANTKSWDSAMSIAASEGISVFVSSGDSGAATCDASFTAAPTTQSLSINYLCAPSYVTCVGGTEFNDTATPTTYWSSTNSTGYVSALGYIPEGAWNESTATNVAGSGGGVSLYILKPTFQTGIGVPADGQRDVPDVSFPASAHDGYFGCEADLTFSGGGTGNCATGGGVLFSGTSAAAPGMAGVAALLVQKLGTKQGNLNPLLYKLAALTSGNPFHDANLTSAGFTTCSLATPSLCNNSTPGPTTITGGLAGYAIGTGYDLVTGWGSVDVNTLLTSAAAQAALTPTSTSLTANPSTITTAQTVIFTSTVTSTSGTPTGTVQFSSNGTALGSPVTLVNGSASTSAQTFSTPATYTISAAYSGSGTYAVSTSPSLAYVVTSIPKTATATSITATATTATTTTPVSFTAHVTTATGTPTGTVQFQVNGSNLGSAVTIASGAATLSNQTLPAGTDNVTAVYSGDSTFATSTSTAATVTVTAIASSTAFTISPASVAANANTTLTFTVTGSGATPTGSVTLKSGSSALGTSNLINGIASVTATPASYGLGVGTYTVYGVYSGDSTYATSTSSNQTLTVTAALTPTLTLSPSPSTLTIAHGASATDTITITTGNNFSGSESLQCSVAYNGTSTLNAPPTCTITTPALPTSGTATSTLNVFTTASSAQSGALASFHFPAPLTGTALCGLFALLLPRRKRLGRLLALLLTAATFAALSGCGGSGSPVSNSNPGTTTGPYTITVNATGVVTATTTIGLTIQ